MQKHGKGVDLRRKEGKDRDISYRKDRRKKRKENKPRRGCKG